LLVHFCCYCQIQKSFPADEAQFVKEVTGMLEATKRSDCGATADAFASNYKSGALTSSCPPSPPPPTS